MPRTCSLSIRPSRDCTRCGTNRNALVKVGNIIRCASDRSCRRRRTGN